MCPWHSEQQAPPALLAVLLSSRSLPSSGRLQHRAQGREERNYKCFIKNLLFMKAKCGAGRSTGVRDALMPNEATVQLFLSPPWSWQWVGHGCSHKRVPKPTSGSPQPRWTNHPGPHPAGGAGAEHPRVPAGWNEPFNLLVLHKCPQTLVFVLQKPLE